MSKVSYELDPPWLKRVRIARRLGYLVLAVAFVFYARNHWDLQIAAESGSLNATPEAQAAEDRFRAALSAVPRSVLVDGTVTFLDPKTLYQDTAAADLPASVIQFIEHADIRAALSDVATAAREILNLRGEEHTRRPGWRPGMFTSGVAGPLARFRPRIAFRTDPTAGWNALRDTYDTACASVICFGNYEATVELRQVLTEIAQNAHDHPLSPARAQEWIKRISQDQISVEGALRDSMGLRAVEIVLNRFYTSNPDGTGALVVSNPEPPRDGGFFLGGKVSGAESWRTSKFWNLFSPVFYDRTSAMKQLLPRDAEIAGADQRPLDTQFTDLGNTDRRLRSPRLGPLYAQLGNWEPWELSQDIGYVADRRAVICILALESIRQSTGAYPQQLSEIAGLVPELALRSPLAADPWLYDRRGESDYDLRIPTFDASSNQYVAFHFRGFDGKGSYALRTKAEITELQRASQPAP